MLFSNLTCSRASRASSPTCSRVSCVSWPTSFRAHLPCTLGALVPTCLASSCASRVSCFTWSQASCVSYPTFFCALLGLYFRCSRTHRASVTLGVSFPTYSHTYHVSQLLCLAALELLLFEIFEFPSRLNQGKSL